MLSDSRSLRSRATAICTAFGIAAALAGAATMVAPTVAAAASCPVSQMSSTSQPACWQPFSSGIFNGGPFNYKLSSNPDLAPNSAAVVSHMTSNNWTFGYPGYQGFMLGQGSRAVFFANASDPTMKIVCLNAFGPGSCTGANGVGIGGQTINVPAGLQPNDNSDGHLTWSRPRPARNMTSGKRRSAVRPSRRSPVRWSTRTRAPGSGAGRRRELRADRRAAAPVRAGVGDDQPRAGGDRALHQHQRRQRRLQLPGVGRLGRGLRRLLERVGQRCTDDGPAAAPEHDRRADRRLGERPHGSRRS